MKSATDSGGAQVLGRGAQRQRGLFVGRRRPRARPAPPCGRPRARVSAASRREVKRGQRGFGLPLRRGDLVQLAFDRGLQRRLRRPAAARHRRGASHPPPPAAARPRPAASRTDAQRRSPPPRSAPAAGTPPAASSPAPARRSPRPGDDQHIGHDRHHPDQAEHAPPRSRSRRRPVVGLGADSAQVQRLVRSASAMLASSAVVRLIRRSGCCRIS